MTHDFCTYFDHRYLTRGLAMFRSLRFHCPEARLWVLCLSPQCHRALAALAVTGIIPIALEEFERSHPVLLAAKRSRSLLEYFFTCTPFLPQYLFARDPRIDTVTYVDSDLFFFHDPAPVFAEAAGHPIAVVGHRFPAHLEWMYAFGRFNVGWLMFRRHPEALACLRWWGERCLEWCGDRLEDGRYADQKYLDQWPARFRGVREIAHKGANVAAWNLANYRLRATPRGPYVDDDPLVFFHFHGVRRIAPAVVDPCVQRYRLRVSWCMEWGLFRPYLRALRAARATAEKILPCLASADGLARESHNHPTPGRATGGGSALLQRLASVSRGVLARRYLLATG